MTRSFVSLVSFIVPLTFFGGAFGGIRLFYLFYLHWAAS